MRVVVRQGFYCSAKKNGGARCLEGVAKIRKLAILDYVSSSSLFSFSLLSISSFGFLSAHDIFPILQHNIMILINCFLH